MLQDYPDYLLLNKCNHASYFSKSAFDWNGAKYTFFQNGHHFSVPLFACKLALVALFKEKYSFEFQV